MLWLNYDEKAEYEIGLSYRLVHFGELGDWAGADLISDWFRRNMRLRYNVSSDPTLRLRKLADFVK